MTEEKPWTEGVPFAYKAGEVLELEGWTCRVVGEVNHYPDGSVEIVDFHEDGTETRRWL